ncbi:hypothetical protein AVEN_274153-1 [Araneus ventricosus]|uniref:Uncharacterized protein n=1 Tax=Araneus ventricosus TaxID=182803 RepID=A0A4Y2G1K3_ARAVE|nr:hypothetical protein AVEN_274153-1 [Araneus ventricosus]
MMRTTPEPVPPLQTSVPHQREEIWPRRIKGASDPLTRGSSMESGFKFGAPQPEAETLPVVERLYPKNLSEISVHEGAVYYIVMNNSVITSITFGYF